MAVIEPYSPCPCGSGQKFKWCCHKVESYADRSQRLYEGGQIDAALATLDEGLRKEKGNAWLLMRKGFLLIRQDRPEEAKQALREVLQSQPKHFGALVLSTRLIAETEGPVAGGAQFQRALAVLPDSDRPHLASMANLLGSYFAQVGNQPAALRHLRLGQTLQAPDSGSEGSGARLLRSLRVDATISPFLRNEEELSPLPEGASGPAASRFQEALEKAERGLWSVAAETFASLENEPRIGLIAGRNLGFCKLWLGDDEGAVAALRRYVATLGATSEAVEIEGLCQQLIPDSPENAVEHVQLTWPLRQRDALLSALNGDPAVASEGKAPIDEDDPDSPEFDEYALLDRNDPYRETPPVDGGSGLKSEDVPRTLGHVYVGEDSAILETYDDGRLDGLVDRFTTLAGPAIPPAHPRTKVLGKVSRRQLAMAWEFKLPEALSEESIYRLMEEEGRRVMRDVWPNTPMDFLGGKTPLQAAGVQALEVPLRAAVLQMECLRQPWSQGFDFAGLREKLRLPPEPEIDPETVDPSTIHLA
ncbi:MAG: tetratricopeptide repeat protein, partial [Isosphaeraceae bacterium]